MSDIEAVVTIDLSSLKKFGQKIDDQLNHKSTGPVTKALKQWGARYRGYIQERFDKFSRGGGNWPPLAEQTKNQRRGGRFKGKKGPEYNVGRRKSIFDKHTANIKNLNIDRHKGSKRGWQKRRLKHAINTTASKRPSPARDKKIIALKVKLAKHQSKSKTFKFAAKRRLVQRLNKANRDKFMASRKFSILRDTNTLFTAMSPVFGKPGSLQDSIPFGIRVGYGGPARHPSGEGVSIYDIARFHQIGAGHLPKREIIVGPPQHIQQLMADDMQRAVDQLRDE